MFPLFTLRHWLRRYACFNLGSRGSEHSRYEACFKRAAELLLAKACQLELLCDTPSIHNQGLHIITIRFLQFCSYHCWVIMQANEMQNGLKKRLLNKLSAAGDQEKCLRHCTYCSTFMRCTEHLWCSANLCCRKDSLCCSSSKGTGLLRRAWLFGQRLQAFLFFFFFDTHCIFKTAPKQWESLCLGFGYREYFCIAELKLECSLACLWPGLSIACNATGIL